MNMATPHNPLDASPNADPNALPKHKTPHQNAEHETLSTTIYNIEHGISITFRKTSILGVIPALTLTKRRMKLTTALTAWHP